MRTKIRLASSENQWLLDQEFYSLGRSKTATLQINRSQASRIHIFLFNDPERGVLVSDAGSSNGAFLNGKLILKPEVLEDADVIDVASEELHVSVAPPDEGEAEDPVGRVEPSVIFNARFNDKGVDWGRNSMVQSRAVGEWLYRTIRLIMARQGKIVRLSDRSVSAVWDKVEKTDAQTLQSLVEGARQINQYGISLNETIAGECGMDPGTILFKTSASIHYTSLKFKQLSNGQLKVVGDDLNLMEDLSAKAAELDCSIVCTERFPSRSEDRSATIPMLMTEIGPRKMPMVLNPLRVD